MSDEPSKSEEAPTFFKTVAVIWSDIDPSTLELEDLAREAQVGDAICTISLNGPADPGLDPSFIGAEEFFNFEPESTDYFEYAKSPFTVSQIRSALKIIEEVGFGEDVDADAIVRTAAEAYLSYAV